MTENIEKNGGTSKATDEEMLSDAQRALMQQENDTVEENTDTGIEQLDEETIKAILDKIQDIDQNGIAFTVVAQFFGDPENEYSKKMVKKEKPNFQKIQSILKEGLLGAQHHHGHFKNEILRHWQWKRTARSRNVEKNSIWFSITGRAYEGSSPFKIEHGYMMESGHGLAFLFDISKFKELPPGALTDWKNFANKHQEVTGGDNIRPELKTYAQSYGYVSTQHVKEFYENGSQADGKTGYTGFVTPFRIGPGSLNGIVIGSDVAPTNTQEIIQTMIATDQEKPNLLLPVYNSHGDLLWPKQMSHDEVVEFVKQKQESIEPQEEISS